MTTLFSFKDLIEANRAAGGHWFGKDETRFFRTRLCGRPFPGKGGSFFVTSEKYVSKFSGTSMPRKYSVRFCTEDGQIGTAEGTKFQQFGDRRTALYAAKMFAAGKMKKPEPKP